MPSRHTASFTVIANDMAVCQSGSGCYYACSGILMGVVSVLGGVHFVKDVLAGYSAGVLMESSDCFLFKV